MIARRPRPSEGHLCGDAAAMAPDTPNHAGAPPPPPPPLLQLRERRPFCAGFKARSGAVTERQTHELVSLVMNVPASSGGSQPARGWRGAERGGGAFFRSPRPLSGRGEKTPGRAERAGRPPGGGVPDAEKERGGGAAVLI